MALALIAFTIPQYEDYPNYWLKAYAEGTTTPKTMALDSAGAATVAKLELSSAGFPITTGSALVIPYIDGAYDLWLHPTEALADANDTTGAIQVANDITGVSAAVTTEEITTALSVTIIHELTTATMTANTQREYIVGDVIQTKEFATAGGDEGSGIYDVVLTTSVTPNTRNIIVGVSGGLAADASYVLRQLPTEDPRRWGAVFDDSTDIGPTLNAMLVAGAVIEIPPDLAVIDTMVSILDNTTIIFNNSKLRTTVDTTVMFQALGRDEWALLGSAVLKGTLVVSGSSAETGLSVTGGFRYVVENIICKLFQGVGFDIDDDATATNRGQRGKYSNCAAYESTVGWEFNDGPAGEYLTLSNCSAAECVTGVWSQAGNISWVGGNITDNTTGIELVTGANPNHGIFSNCNINHNGINLNATDIELGQTFANCHWYSNGAGTSKIIITNSKGVNIDGGQIDCPVRVEDGAATLNGLNTLRNMTVTGSVFVLEGDDLINLRAYGNYDFTGKPAGANLGIQPTLVTGGVGFTNSWVDYGAGRALAGFYISESGNVNLQGMIKDGTTGTTIFTLPTGYRPEEAVEIIVDSNSAAGFIFIDTAGAVSMTAGDNTKLSLDGVKFRAKT